MLARIQTPFFLSQRAAGEVRFVIPARWKALSSTGKALSSTMGKQSPLPRHSPSGLTTPAAAGRWTSKPDSAAGSPMATWPGPVGLLAGIMATPGRYYGHAWPGLAEAEGLRPLGLALNIQRGLKPRTLHRQEYSLL